MSHASESEKASETFADWQELLNLGLKELKSSGQGADSYQTGFEYAKMRLEPQVKGRIEAQEKKLQAFDLSQLQKKNEAVAFWINAYNFAMVAKILKAQNLVDGVKDFGSLLSPYRVFQQKDVLIGGRKMSLDDIEKGTLLGEAFQKKGWKDARVHFAVNCASVGCPPLIPKIYKAEILDEQLSENVKKALRTARHLKVEGDVLYLTHLFKWYAKDFEAEAASVQAFVLKYVADESLKNQISKAAKTKFIDYDWRLNRPENFN